MVQIPAATRLLDEAERRPYRDRVAPTREGPLTFRTHAVATLAAIAAVSAACADSTSALPGASPTPAVESPSAQFPAVTRPATVYAATASLSRYPGSQPQSRYVLYAAGDFRFQIIVNGALEELTGRYARAGTMLTFEWDIAGGLWMATGALNGEELIVRYNEAMLRADFANDTYLRLLTIP